MGWQVKNKFKKQKEFLLYLNEFNEFLYVNMNLYKTNISDIINNYLIQQNNKNANFNNLFQKNNNINTICTEKIKDCVYNDEVYNKIKMYLSVIGQSDLIHEIEKINEMNKMLHRCIEDANIDIKTRGDLYFKIWLSVGLAVCIVLW